MKIEMHLADDLYKKLLASGNRVSGSIALESPTCGNFNAWRTQTASPREERRYIRLPHGTASVDTRHARLSLAINLGETGIIPTAAIISESARACTFIDNFLI